MPKHIVESPNNALVLANVIVAGKRPACWLNHPCHSFGDHPWFLLAESRDAPTLPKFMSFRYPYHCPHCLVVRARRRPLPFLAELRNDPTLRKLMLLR